MFSANERNKSVIPGPSNWHPGKMDYIQKNKFGATVETKYFRTNNVLTESRINSLSPSKIVNSQNTTFNDNSERKGIRLMQVTKRGITKMEVDANVTNNKFKEQKLQKTKEDSVRFLSGTIDKVLKWYKILPEFAHYEVLGPVVKLESGHIRLQTVLLLRSKGPVLKVVYYNNNWINLPNFYLGQVIRCVGRMIDANTIQAFKIREATTDEIEHFTRITYICDQEVTNISRVHTGTY